MAAILLKYNNVDIYQPPKLDSRYLATPNVQLTLGDLHANALKLFYFLIKHGVIYLDKNKEHANAKYQQIIEIYQSINEANEFQSNYLKQFIAILQQAVINNLATVRLIGDELADRGQNDYLTLKILKYLVMAKVPVEILLSNHSIEFIEAYETAQKFYPPRLQPKYAYSLYSLQGLIETRLVSRSQVLGLIDKYYKPCLKAISYSFDKINQEMTIYSHAAIDLKVIELLANKLDVTYADTTSGDLANTIQKINSAFQNKVFANQVHNLYTAESIKQAGVQSSAIDSNTCPFEFLMWNRNYQQLDRPAKQYHYTLKFVHGHDAMDPTQGNVNNLDNDLGKTLIDHIGLYTVYYVD